MLQIRSTRKSDKTSVMYGGEVGKGGKKFQIVEIPTSFSCFIQAMRNTLLLFYYSILYRTESLRWYWRAEVSAVALG